MLAQTRVQWLRKEFEGFQNSMSVLGWERGPPEGEGHPFCMAPIPNPPLSLTRATAYLHDTEAGGGLP